MATAEHLDELLLDAVIISAADIQEHSGIRCMVSKTWWAEQASGPQFYIVYLAEWDGVPFADAGLAGAYLSGVAAAMKAAGRWKI